jgi:hypothetical protein
MDVKQPGRIPMAAARVPTDRARVSGGFRAMRFASATTRSTYSFDGRSRLAYCEVLPDDMAFQVRGEVEQYSLSEELGRGGEPHPECHEHASGHRVDCAPDPIAL